MKMISCKNLLLRTIVLGCLCIMVASTGWASTPIKDQQKEGYLQQTSKKEKSAVKLGRTKYSHQTLAEVYVLGVTKLDHVTVKGSTKVLGKCKIKASQLNTLKVKGHTFITHSNIQEIASILGKTDIDHSYVKQLRVQGRLHIVESTIANNLEVCGTLLVKKSAIQGKLKLGGRLEAIQTEVVGPVEILGRVKAQDATFQHIVNLIGKMNTYQTTFAANITAVAPKILLHDTTTQAIYIKQSKKHEIKKWAQKYKFLSFLLDKLDEPQELILSGKTVVQGPITFESGKGIVIVKDKAELQGEVIGGTIRYN